MTFNPSKKDLKNKLIDDKQDQNEAKDIEELQNQYLDFIKTYDEILDYENKLNLFTKKDYEKVKDY